MMPADLVILRGQVKQDEGLRLKPYVDTVGKITIGYGHNLSDNGITQAEAESLLEDDLVRCVADLEHTFPAVLTMDGARQIVLADMCFNLGAGRLAGFTRMWQRLAAHDFAGAAEEMLASTWATQVGKRATRLAAAMASGELKP